MDVLLDIQSELSLPEGGCDVEALVRRAAELGISRLALADRATLAAAPGFIRHARAAGIEPRVGVRVMLRAGRAFDLLVFPRRPQDLIALEVLAASQGEVSAGDLARGGGQEAFLAIASVRPHALGDRDELRAAAIALEEVHSVLGRGFWLGLASGSVPAPELGHSTFSPLVELGRDLHLPTVLAPPICIVEVEDASLHRLLVSIRGDHESAEETPRSGRPVAGSTLKLARYARRATRLGSLVEAVKLHGVTALHEAAEDLFAQIAAPDVLIEAPHPIPLRDLEDLECLRERVLSGCAARRRLVSPARLEAELSALARRGAVSPLLKLSEIMRSLGSRPVFGVAPAWADSWVSWGLGLSGSTPSGDERNLPAWVDGHGPLPAIELEGGEIGARTVRSLLEIAGAREPLVAERLTPVVAARWLGEARGFDAAQVRRLLAIVEGRSPAPDRAPPGSRRLAALAVRLTDRVIGLSGAGGVRVWVPVSLPGRKLGRLTEDALSAGGLGVRVTASAVLSILERAGVGARRLAPQPLASVASAPDDSGGDAPVDWNELSELLAGPLAGRGGSAFARVLRARHPEDRRDLARCLVLVRRAPDAPAPRLPVAMTSEPPAGDGWSGAPIVFTADLVAALRARGITEATALELLRRGAEGRGAPLAPLRSDLQHELVRAGQPPEHADILLAAIPRLVPHLEEEGPWLSRAGAFAVLGDLAHDNPAILASAMADLHHSRLQAIGAWARARGIAILPPDLNLSAVDTRIAGPDSRIAGLERGKSSLRLGLIHLPGVDRATADIIAIARGERPFAGIDDLLRRLRGRIADSSLRRLLGDQAQVSGSAEENGATTVPFERARRSAVPAEILAIRGMGRAANGLAASAPILRRGPSHKRSGWALERLLETSGDGTQYDLFSATHRGPRVFTAALARYGILRIDRAAEAPAGSLLRTAGVIRGMRGTVARGGRKLIAARLEDGEWGLDLLFVPASLAGAGQVPLGRAVIVDGRVHVREGKPELVVESAVPLESLANVAQPVLEVVLPPRFRRVRALKLRLLQSPGRSPVRVRSQDAEGEAMAAVLSRFAVTLDDALVADLRDLVGDRNVTWMGNVVDQAGAA